jgi:serine/threonine-protein kinase
MNLPPNRPDATVDLSAPRPVDEVLEDYRAAWQGALAGRDPPKQETYLASVAEPDRPSLQRQLTELDDKYFSYLFQQRQQGASTLDLIGGLRPSEPAGAATTLQQPEGSEQASGATVDFGPAAAKAAMDDGFEVSTPSPVTGYEILGELGRGGMGVVYKARQKGLNRLVALKMLLAGTHASAEQLLRFNTEAEAVARLQHPNIVQIYEVGQHEGLAFFSLEFVDGHSLAHKLGGNPQPPRQAAQMIMVLARAMHYAHENGIVHRDLKPANVLLTSSGVPKITDFGLAKRLEGDSSQTKSGTLMGTPSYMAPEQARGDVRQVGPSADIHALGAILYELLTGRPPFVSANMMDTIMQVLRNDPVPPSHLQAKVPPDLETICLKCLQKEPHQRYASAGALADDLDRFLAGEPIQARPVSGVERLWRWCKRNPRVAALTAITFFLLVAGVIGSTGAAITIAQERNQKEREREAADEARWLAEERKLEADAANEQAQKNAKIATEQSRLAVESVRTLIREAQKEIGDNPNLQSLKLKLVEIALADLDKVAKSDENSRLLGQVMAGAYMQMGDLFVQLGQSEKAFSQYQKSHAILQGLAEKDPEGDVAQANLAAAFTVLGQMSLELRRDIKASLDYYQKALEIRKKLNARQLSDKLNPTKVKQELAESHTRVGVTFLRLGEAEKARGYFQDALVLRQELAARAGQEPAAQLDVARSFNALGEVEFRTRNWAAARQRFHEALQLCERVHQQDAGKLAFQWELANTLGNLGVFEVRTGGGEAAQEHYTRYLALMQGLVDQAPKNALFQRYLGLANYRMATLAGRRNDAAAAERCNRACLDIRERLALADAKNESRQRELMLVLPRCGKHAKAAEMAAKLLADAALDREVLVEIAQCLAQCAAAVPDQSDLRVLYADQALDALKRAVAKGYKDAVILETEPDLDPLRPHPAFQSLLAQLKQS